MGEEYGHVMTQKASPKNLSNRLDADGLQQDTGAQECELPT